MRDRAVIALDVGKTLSKLTLWHPQGRLLDRRSRPNVRIEARAYVGLDAPGIESWLSGALRDFGRLADVGALIPVGHGAAAALIRAGQLSQLPLDYEQPIPEDCHGAYSAQRDPFALTGSPALPNGLNLGAQLHFLEALQSRPLDAAVTIIPWAQYWSWLLSGVASADVTNLGCHTDLWFPLAATHSALSIQRGWAARMAPLRPSNAVLGALTPQWVERTGLAPDVQIYCGVHDSNAALVAAHAFPEIAGHDATVLSTGTWFIAMRTPAGGSTPAMEGTGSVPLDRLPETRDCLLNVNAFGRPTPSARFMGGREIEILTAATTAPATATAPGTATPAATATGPLDSSDAARYRVDAPERQPALLRAVPDVLTRGTMVLPTFAPGAGPYPNGRGRWMVPPEDDFQRQAAVCLYAALVADVSLDLIGAKDRLLIEGRFAQCEVFVRALASLRPDTAVYVARSESDASFGALRLVNPDLPPPSSLTRVAPLSQNLQDYRRRWRQEAARAE
jgi:sugar (pentulose or hexulose) kinase